MAVQKQKLKKRLAGLVVLALVASTAIEFHSWYQESSVEDRRRLSAPQVPIVPRSQPQQLTGNRPTGNDHQDRAWRGLVKRGFESGTVKFNATLRNQTARRMQAVRLKAETEKRKLAEQGEHASVEANLAQTEQIWLRGNYVPQGTSGKFNGNTWRRDEQIQAAEAAARVWEEKHALEKAEENYEPFRICDRPTDVSITEEPRQCPEITLDKPIFLLEGTWTHGRTGNNIVEFLHAIQQAKDQDLQLGMMMGAWPLHLITKYWLSVKGDDWGAQFEEAFCAKVFYSPSELEGYDVIHANSKELLLYQSNAPLDEYIENQEYYLRVLFRNYNTGQGTDGRRRPVSDMCSGIKNIFGSDGEDPSTAIYSVIHSRSLEGEPGKRLLGSVARKSGCDPLAALHMEPDYIKSILEPLGMMQHPIVFISDGQDDTILKKLKSDPELGPMIRELPQTRATLVIGRGVSESVSWIGGDMTLGIMSNVFIGNPASTFAGIIAKTRLAFGFGHNHLFRAKNNNGQWRTVCGDHCVFDKSILGVMA